MNLSKNVKIILAKAGQAAATTAVNSDAIDMTNYDGCLFFATIAAKNDGNYIEIEQSAVADFAAKVALKGSKVVPGKNGEVVYVDVFRPVESQGKYLRAVITRTASSATGDIYALLYDGRTKPEVSDVADVLKGVLLISPEASE